MPYLAGLADNHVGAVQFGSRGKLWWIEATWGRREIWSRAQAIPPGTGVRKHENSDSGEFGATLLIQTILYQAEVKGLQLVDTNS